MNRLIYANYLDSINGGALFWECPLCHHLVLIEGTILDHRPLFLHGYGRCVRAVWAA